MKGFGSGHRPRITFGSCTISIRQCRMLALHNTLVQAVFSELVVVFGPSMCRDRLSSTRMFLFPVASETEKAMNVLLRLHTNQVAPTIHAGCTSEKRRTAAVIPSESLSYRPASPINNSRAHVRAGASRTCSS